MDWKCEQVSRIIFAWSGQREQMSGAFYMCVVLWGKDPDFSISDAKASRSHTASGKGITKVHVNVSSILHDESKS